MGAIPESQIAEFITKVGGKGNGAPPVAEALAAATEARDAGDMQTAADIYDAILAQAPETIEAIAGLGDLLFEAGDTEGAEALLATSAGGQEGRARRWRPCAPRSRWRRRRQRLAIRPSSSGAWPKTPRITRRVSISP